MGKRAKKPVKSAVITAFIAIAIVAILGYLIATQRAPPAVATVNGAPILQSDLDSAYANLPPTYTLALTKDQFLEQLIDRLLLLQEAKKQGFTPLQLDVDAEYQRLTESFPTPEALAEAMKERGFTEAMVKKDIEERQAITLYLDDLISNFNVTDEQVRTYYATHPTQFQASSGQIRIAHILVASKEEAQNIISLLDDGEDFRELASNRSIDPTAKSTGGDLGFISKGDTVAEFEKAAFSLDIGEVSLPIETVFGFHIIARLPDTISYNDAKKSITSLVANELQAGAVQQLITDLREQSTIVYTQPKKKEFSGTTDQLCSEDGKPVLRMYTASTCDSCQEMATLLQSLAGDTYVLKVWEIDTGDNLITKETESGLGPSEFDILKRYDSKGAVPAYVLGCKYVRLGNAFEILDLETEREEFSTLLGTLV